MKVIPVMDILNGIVVHAVRGRRQEYQPLKSTLSDSVDPLEIAKTFKTLGFGELYVADLDAITNRKANFQTIKNIIDKTGLKLMVDAGIADIEIAKKLLSKGISKVIIGTETLKSMDFVIEAVRILGNERILVSLDLKAGEVLVTLGFKGFKDPICLLREFREMGVSTVIILDLTCVGANEGVNASFLEKALAEKMNVFVGGGVRDIKDLIELKSAGVSGVLVATALHTGKISIKELGQNGFL